MFQSFEDTARPDQGPPRIAALREIMAREGIAGYLVPRSDAHQGEYVAPGDERLAWLTGFTGSAGFCAVLAETAGLFVDGRYREQARTQVDTTVITPVDFPETRLADWLRAGLPDGGTVGFDPWLYSAGQVGDLEERLSDSAITLQPMENLVDRIWPDRPSPPCGKIVPYAENLAGETHESKRDRLGRSLGATGQEAAVLTLGDSIAWLLNIRGSDIPHNPVPHGFAILHANGHLTFFVETAKLDDAARRHLGDEVTIRPPEAFGPGLRSLTGRVRLDRGSVPLWVVQQLEAAGVPHDWGEDPTVLPKACKNDSEIAATRNAHLRDAAAMCEFLAWFYDQPEGTLAEIDVVKKLEACRRATGELLDISFSTIAGSGPHGALAHYRVTDTSNRRLEAGDILVLDSGGQYLDGTTDITRTLPVGDPGEDERAAFTRVLQGMIAMSRTRWPEGLAGRDLDAIARHPLWLADQDYAHGTGHGVGVHLCVHEGPQRLSRISEIPLRPGMIVSNEPGYYREGAFGIRIENLLVVTPADTLADGDQHGKLCFETLNFVPVDRRLVEIDMLCRPEREWLDGYHAQCRNKIGPRLSARARLWLEEATAPL